MKKDKTFITPDSEMDEHDSLFNSYRLLRGEDNSKEISEFNQKYPKEKEILVTEHYNLYICYNKNTNNRYIAKEYKEEFLKLIKNDKSLIDEEIKNLKNCQNKYINKLYDFLVFENKIIFIFDFFEITLRELLIKQKKLSIDEIRILLIQINEAIKYLKCNGINDIIFTPDNIGIIEDNDFKFHSIKLFNLFPYKQLKQFLKKENKEQIGFKSFLYLSPEELNYKDDQNSKNEFNYITRKNDSLAPNPAPTPARTPSQTPAPTPSSSKASVPTPSPTPTPTASLASTPTALNYGDIIRTITTNLENITKKDNINYFYSKSFLWNIGLLIYELYFGELPSSIKIEKNKFLLDLNDLKKSGDILFDDLIHNLLIVDPNKRIEWSDYFNHKFFKKMEIKSIFNVLFKKEFNDNLEELDLISENIDDYNLLLSSPIKFNNLIKINLSHNKIKDLSFLKEKFQKLKFLIIEDNNIKDLDALESNTLKELEFLSLSGNSFNSLYSFTKKDWTNLNYLSLSKNNITNISDLLKVNLPNLNALNLSNNNIYSIECFKDLKFPELRELFLNNNNIREINNITDFSNLEILNLSYNVINDINNLKDAKFKNKIKELYLSNNPITYYNLLYLSYFQSLERISLPLINGPNGIDFHFLSVNIKLYGYEFEKSKDIGSNRSALFVPLELYQSYLLDNSNFNMFNYKNTFKIITNKDIYTRKLKNYFIENILNIEPNLVNITESDQIKNENYKIFVYYSHKAIINEILQSNTFNLVKEYKNLHKINNNYNKIPNYLEKKENNYYLNFNCPLKENLMISENNPSIDNHLLSLNLKKYNYYKSFPLIFINPLYYKDFISFFYKFTKDTIFNDNNKINEKIILPFNDIKIDKHSNDNQKINLIADVIENCQYYKAKDFNINLISQIKESLESYNSKSEKLKKVCMNYRQYIEGLIINVMDILVEYFLFVKNKKPYYYVCPYCNGSILYEFDNEEKNETDINKDLDYSLYKSISICNNINDIIFKNYKDNNNKMIYSKKKCQNFKPKNYIPANPPKKGEATINLIYHDQNHNKSYFKKSINDNAKHFENESKGTFIFSNSMEIFELIMKKIVEKNKNEIKNKFLLISTGQSFEEIMKFLKIKGYKDYICKACIYCMNKESYEKKFKNNKEYDLLGGIFTTPTEVSNFIKNNLCENNVIFEDSKLVTYENYSLKYYDLHKIISKYYNGNFQNSYNVAINILRDFIKNDSEDEEKLMKGLEVFQNNREYEVLKEYTKNTIYSYINKCLLNLESLEYEKVGYFIGGLMFKLNEYGIKKNKGNKKTNILYRGIYINFDDALSYQIQEEKIISFQTFLSTTLSEKVAKKYSKEETYTLEERKEKSMISTIIEINHIWKDELFPLCFDISEISQFKHEIEFLFPPYTFFRVKNFDLNLDNHTLRLKLESLGKKEILEYPIKAGKKPKLNEEQDIIEV